MAIFTPSSNLSLRILLVSTCVLSSALLLHSSLPTISRFVTTELPSLYGAILPWLRPPYLYILINCIIISIVVSSKLQHGCFGSADTADDGRSPIPPQKAVAVVAAVGPKDVDDSLGYAGYESGYVYGGVEDSVPAVTEEEPDVVVKEVSVEEVAVPLSGNNEPERSDSVEFAFMDWKEKERHAEREKLPVSARFGHRRSAKSSPEVGKTLRVSRSRRHDTLESTWKTITDGRAIPLTRHLKKSDTWDTHPRRGNEENTPPPPNMKKAETFSDRSTAHVTGSGKVNSSWAAADSGKLRREPSLGQDDLNRRVEAFIRKFNEEMRLQREESLNQFQEMINRGTS